MLTLCAWCEEAGERTVLGETPEPGEDSHGICAEHLRRMREELHKPVGIIVRDLVSGREFLLPVRDGKKT